MEIHNYGVFSPLALHRRSYFRLYFHRFLQLHVPKVYYDRLLLIFGIILHAAFCTTQTKSTDISALVFTVYGIRYAWKDGLDIETDPRWEHVHLITCVKFWALTADSFFEVKFTEVESRDTASCFLTLYIGVPREIKCHCNTAHCTHSSIPDAYMPLSQVSLVWFI